MDIIIFLVLPVLYLLDAASRILIKRNIISLDKLGILCLYKEVVIFGVVLARLGAVIAETSYVFESHEVVMVRNAAFEHFCSSFSYLGIEIRAVRILYFKQPTHMIYSRDALADRLAVFDIKLIEKSSRTGLHGMAKSDRLHAGIPAEPACKLSHGIGIVKEICVRADFFHIVGEILEDGNSAQSSENSADAVRIRDSLAKSVFFRHFEVDYRARIVETDLDGVYNKISPAKCVLALLDAEIFADRRAVLVYIPIERRDH